MKAQSIITVNQIGEHFHIETSVLFEFADFGLFPAVSADGETGIEVQNLNRLAEIINLHQALGINKEGIEVILSQREQISGLKEEIERLHNTVERLERYMESDSLEGLSRSGLLIDIDY
jgi:hypothetical protein